MEIVLKDQDGNDILSPTLTQWDQGVSIVIRDVYYPLDNGQRAYLHFYNATKQQIYSQACALENHELTSEIPNQLLTEAYPITVHVYVSDGGDVFDAGSQVKARTVFTATISVEPRMKPDMYAPIDNVGAMTMRDVQEELARQIDVWEGYLAAFFGDVFIDAVQCYEDDGVLYSDSTHETSIVYSSGTVYQDVNTGIKYYYDASTETLVELSVSGAISYCKDRADACAAAQANMASQYQSYLQTASESVGQAAAAQVSGAKADITQNTLDGYKIRVVSELPIPVPQSDYGTIMFIV